MIARHSRVIAAPIVLSLLVSLDLPPEGGSHATRAISDHAQLVNALERLVRTGEPRHVTHDEGEELDAALKAALTADADPDLQWLATRAALPIVPTIRRPLSSRKTPGALHLRAERVLTLPWPVEYVADIDARLDGRAWQPIVRVKSGASEDRSLDELLPAAAAITPGFHTLALRARIRYSHAPAGMSRRETRDLLTVHYGVWGSPKTGTDAVRPFFDAAGSVSAARLDPTLPDTPFSSWLATLPRDAKEPSPTDWHVEWCGLHESLSDEGLVPRDVCVVVRRSGPRRGPFAETWIKVGALQAEGDETRWVRTTPALVAAYFYEGGKRARVPLADIASYLSEPCDTWPSARLVVNSAGITVSPAAIVPNVPAELRVMVANMGDADAIGITINVLVSSDGDRFTRRTFVRTIRAGGSVEIETPVVFPDRYGFVDVRLAPGHDDMAVRADQANENHHAHAVINQRAAPADYLQHLCLAAGKASGSCPH